MILDRFFAVLGVKVDKKSIGKANSSIQGLQKGANGLRNILLGSFAGLSIGAAARSLRNLSQEADKIAKTSKAFGLAGKDYQAFAFAAERSGLSTDKLRIALTGLQKRIAAANFGSKEAQETFDRLGLSVNNLVAMDPADQFRAVAGALGSVENQTQKAGLAFRLFEESGASLLPLFAEGREGLAGLEAQFRDLGGGFDDDTLKRAEAFEDSMTNLRVVFTRVRIQAFSLLGPVKSLVDWFTEAGKGGARIDAALRTVAIGLGLVSAGFVVLRTKAIAGWIATFAPVAAVAVAIAALALVFEDLWGAIEGRDSVTGRLLNWLTTMRDLLPGLNALFGGFGKVIGDLVDPFTTLEEKVDSLLKLFRDLKKIPGEITSLFVAAFASEHGGTFSERLVAARTVLGGGTVGDVIRAAPAAAAGNRALSTPAVTVNVSGAGDPDAVGRAVAKHVSREFSQASSNLTPAVGGAR